ncbi:hypothetical protein Fmac_006433 [Flemingia macrophylla]|uniref:Uncharacterized protein n=1 Tax=Flemingia macrophylla TaxID=520843 RepID=A0ABD1NAK3_9FABA
MNDDERQRMKASDDEQQRATLIVSGFKRERLRTRKRGKALYQNCVDEKPYAIKWSTAPDSRYFLQRVIRQEFSECTVINVAHRVPTVIGSDMVMVLSYVQTPTQYTFNSLSPNSYGNVATKVNWWSIYDEPSKLMEDQSSSFSKLVVEYWSSCSRISL